MQEPYKQWAQGHIDRIKKNLNDARAEHSGAVKERIESVGQMKDVVSITEGLFALSKVWSQLSLKPYCISSKNHVGDRQARGRKLCSTPEGHGRL